MTLELRGVEKTRGEFEFGPIDLAVGTEVLAVLGPSGSGKSTLLSLIAGILQPDAGTVTLGGRPLTGRPIEERRVGMVFQDGALFPHLTARENIGYAATAPARVDELAEMLEVRPVLDRRPGSLSGGERQRVALARTLATAPDVLLLDEPLSSLDTPTRRRLRDELHALFGTSDVPIIYVTHDQREATALGDRIAILRDGSVEQVGTPAAILNRPATEFVAAFTGTENVFDAVVSDASAGSARLRVGDVTLRAWTDASAGSTVSACVRPSRVQVRAVRESEGSADGNTLTGTVRRRLNEGDEHRVVVTTDRADLVLTALVRSSSLDGSTVEPGDGVHLSIPPDSIHVIR